MPPEAPVENASQEPSVAGWMRELPTLKPDATPTPEAKKEEPAKVPPSAASAAQPATTSTTSGEPQDKSSAKPASTTLLESADAKASASSKTTETDDEAQEKWPRSGDDWAKYKAKDKERTSKLKAEIAAREAKAAELETKYKALETEYTGFKEKATTVDPATQSEMERIRNENKELSDRLAVVDVTAHPKFVAYFKGKVDREISLAKAIVGEDKAEEVAKVLLMPDGEYKTAKLEEVMGDLTPLQSQRLTNRLDALEQIEMERRTEIARAEENRGKITEEQKGAAEKRAAEGKKLFSEVVKSVQDPKNGSAIFQLRDGDEAWNSQVKQTIDHAEKLLLGNHGMKPTDLVKASLDAAAFPVLLNAYQKDMKERDDMIGKLEAQVKELSAATPGSGKAAAAGGEQQQPETKVKHGMSPMEASRSWVSELKASQQ